MNIYRIKKVITYNYHQCQVNIRAVVDSSRRFFVLIFNIGFGELDLDSGLFGLETRAA